MDSQNRTGRDIATAVENCVLPIEDLKGKITKEERDEMITAASIKYGISEHFIRTVGCWHPRKKDEDDFDEFEEGSDELPTNLPQLTRKVGRPTKKPTNAVDEGIRVKALRSNGKSTAELYQEAKKEVTISSIERGSV